MPEQIIVWQCVHCKKKRTYSEKWVIKHEKYCMSNPNSKNCFKCVHLLITPYPICEKDVKDRKSSTALKCEYYEER